MEQLTTVNLVLGVVVITLLIISLLLAKTLQGRGERIEELEVLAVDQVDEPTFSGQQVIYLRSQYEMYKKEGQVSQSFGSFLRNKYPDMKISKEDLQTEVLEDIHSHFGLSYAAYLVIPRLILQSLSPQLQHRFVKCMSSAGEELGDWDGTNYYTVRKKNNKNRFVKDDLKDYHKGRRKITKNEISKMI